MKTRNLLAPLCLALAAASPLAAELRYVPVPSMGTGSLNIKVEYERATETPRFVEVAKVPEGVAGDSVNPVRSQVYIGPSTKRLFPLLNITPNAPGLVVLDAEAGLTSNEVSMELGSGVAGSAWELPLISDANDFNANSTAFIAGLTKNGTQVSNLSLYNLGDLPATCSFKILRPGGTTLEERTGLTVPPIGARRFDDALRLVRNNGNVNASVTCDRPFYAISALPNTDRTKVRLNYPATKLPGAATTVTMIDRRGTFLNVTAGNSFLVLPLPFETAGTPNGIGTRYRSLTIEFDVRTADPDGFTVIRSIVDLFRVGGRRFNKTLYFSFFERFFATGGPKVSLDLGTPYIESTVKRTLDMSGSKTFRFRFVLDADKKSIVEEIRNGNNALVASFTTGLYNDDLNAVGANVPLLEFGLPGIADNAYFPPFGWKFSNLKVVATK